MIKRLIFFPVVFLFGVELAFALPVFARRYQTSCTTCHAIIPKLNPFGIAFRNNGFRVPANDAQLVEGQDVSLGAPAWKQLWPRAVWPGAIPNVPPLAVRVLMDVNIRPSQPVNVNFDFPNLLGLYFAGPAGETFSFFGSVFLQGSTNNIFLDRAYGQFRISPERTGANWLNLKVGRIDTKAEPFASSFRRPTAQTFNVGDYRAVQDGFGFRDRDAGAELWGAVTGPDNRGGLEYGTGVVQGTGGRPENNNAKDYYWSAMYKFGGLGVAGSITQQDTPAIIENYSEWSFAVGAFGYYGNGETRITATPSNEFTRTGVKFDAYLDDLNVFGAFVSGRDDLRGAAAQRINTSAFFIEADYMLLPWVMPVVRFEKTDFSDGRRGVRELIMSTNFAVRANVKVLLEGRKYYSDTGSGEGVVRLEFVF